jgi:hypothetical protein
MIEEKDFLDEFADEGDESLVIEQPVEAEPEPASGGRQRGPDGKFIKAEAQARAEQAEKGAKEAAQAEVTEPPSDDDETGTVPIHVLKALRKENQELKARMGQQTQPKAPGFITPQVDFDEDPKSHMISLKMHMSAFMATQQNGEEAVNEAWAAFDQACRVDPKVSAMSYELLNHPHPMAEIVKWHSRERELAAIQEAGGLEALKQRWLAEQGIASQPGQIQQRPNLPPSLAGTGKVRSTEVNAMTDDPFDSLFKKR